MVRAKNSCIKDNKHCMALIIIIRFGSCVLVHKNRHKLKNKQYSATKQTPAQSNVMVIPSVCHCMKAQPIIGKK